jgi:hypothetical protein
VSIVTFAIGSALIPFVALRECVVGVSAWP